ALPIYSDVVLGAALTSSGELRQRMHTERSMRGSVAGPFEVWLALRGLRTLAVRLDRAQPNAQTIAERLPAHPAVIETRYPGLPADPGHERAAAQQNGVGAVIAFSVDPADNARAIARPGKLAPPATAPGGGADERLRRDHRLHRRHPRQSHLQRGGGEAVDPDDLPGRSRIPDRTPASPPRGAADRARGADQPERGHRERRRPVDRPRG